MRLTCVVLPFIFAVVLMYEQNQYTVKFERAGLVRFNHSMLDFAKVISYKHNRTQACLNITMAFKVAVGNALKIEVQAYRFASNEYREFPLRFAFDFCSTAKKNEFGLAKMFECGNFTACPFIETTYLICRWFPDAHRFPPYVPAGRYMLDLKLFYGSLETLFFQAYGEVDYPII